MTASSIFVSATGDGYERQMGRWSRRLAPLFVEFTGIDAAERILDVGCGTGSLGATLVRNHRIGAVHGIDLSPSYVDHARRTNVAPLTFEVADACALPFADASFDHALSMLVLPFVPQPARAVAEMRRVTRRGGIVAAASWDSGGGLPAYRLVFDAAAMLAEDGEAVRDLAYGRPAWRPGSLTRLWRDAGLAEIVEGDRTIRMDFAHFEDFWAPVESGNGPAAGYLATLAPKARMRLRDAVWRAYREGAGDGPRSFAATARVVRGSVR